MLLQAYRKDWRAMLGRCRCIHSNSTNRWFMHHQSQQRFFCKSPTTKEQPRQSILTTVNAMIDHCYTTIVSIFAEYIMAFFTSIKMIMFVTLWTQVVVAVLTESVCIHGARTAEWRVLVLTRNRLAVVIAIYLYVYTRNNQYWWNKLRTFEFLPWLCHFPVEPRGHAWM